MEIEFDLTIAVISVMFGLPGFILIAMNTNFWTAVGVVLIAMGMSVRRTR